MSVETRTLTSPDELPEWMRGCAVGFLRPPEVTEEEVRARRVGIELARTQGCYDGGRCVGTFRTFTQQLTVPGGTTLPSCAVSNVTVSPTHRRRGLLSRMTRNALDAAKERGETVSTLIAAEYRIYGRFGYGPAAWTSEFEVEVARTGLDVARAAVGDGGSGGGPGEGGRIDFADPEEVRRLGPELHERFRHQPHRQGTVDRPEHWWRQKTGALRHPGDHYPSPHFVVHRDAEGIVQGMAAYKVTEKWAAKLPENVAEVLWLTAATPAAERALWRFLASIDWISRVRSGHRAPDDLLPHFFPDPRAARTTAYADFLWLRPLDVPRMLEARTYGGEDALVLELRDEAGYADGRYRLEAGPGTEGAVCTRTREEPDLAMDVGELGTLYLGDESAVRLAALGRVEERRAGTAVRADTLLRTSRRAWCPDGF